MKKIATVIALLAILGCAKEHGSTAAPAPSKSYPMKATIVSRDAKENSLNLDNENVPDVMPPMKMDYEVRGAKVDSLPADGTKVQVTLHEQDGSYWVTDVKPQ
jgi:Cu/Ag efflux protein CusF